MTISLNIPLEFYKENMKPISKADKSMGFESRLCHKLFGHSRVFAAMVAKQVNLKET